MDIEFHYYMTYLVAAKAGFGPEDALTIAYACQYVDDNDMILEIDKGKTSAYRNYISQTRNILKPKAKLLRIYPLFHFVPGDPCSSTAWRKDGKMHWLNTTPNSENANRIFDAALATKDLYRIGVACHAYADTWAHQNFVGYYEPFNAMNGPFDEVTPNIGHAEAGHDPDRPAMVWQDRRLCHERVDNKTRFLEAAEQILRKLMRFADPAVGEAAVDEKAAELLQSLDWAIGERDQSNSRKNERIARYSELSDQEGYGNGELAKYDEDLWFEEAIDEKVRGLRDRGDFVLARWDPIVDKYTWKDRQNYRLAPWYLFQKAVKAHQDDAWEILAATNLRWLELPHL
jgi:hypothetical protein